LAKVQAANIPGAGGNRTLPVMTTDIRASWESYLARQTLLLSDFVRIGHDVDAEDLEQEDATDLALSVSWRSETLKSILASLLLIDLASILDEALEAVLDGKPAPAPEHRGRTLHRRLLHARHLGLLLDFDSLDALRGLRNSAAHERHRLKRFELRGHQLAVRRQLAAWGMIDDSADFHAAAGVGEWKEVGPGWEREVWAGADDAERRRAWGFTITERAQRGTGIERPEEARVRSLGETEPEWYAEEPGESDEPLS
ncbi:MAG: hypothetical protein KUG77_25455, partial [Nannocystaceae bacterium]|nr:hypothetical protein [Nannocystaceae bacterium]